MQDVDQIERSLAEQSQCTKELFNIRFRMIIAGHKFGIRQIDMASVLGISRQLVHKAIIRAKEQGLLDDEVLPVTGKPPQSLIDKVKQACIDLVN